jgi:hypothetical protein
MVKKFVPEPVGVPEIAPVLVFKFVTIQVFPEDKWWRRSYTKRISRRTQPPGSFLKKPLDSKIGTL